MQFKIEKCPSCGKFHKMMFSNNPICQPICFDCIREQLTYDNLEHANLFCRTYNLPFKPDLWGDLVDEVEERVFEEYTDAFFEDDTIKNLFYDDETSDIYAKINKEWQKCRTQEQIYAKIHQCKDAYMQRAEIRWGEGYTFNEYLTLDNSYNETIKANNMTNKLQKDAVKMLCKLDVEQNRALKAHDTKAMRDYAAVHKEYADIANLDDMIEQTKTEDITTVAELVHRIEKSGFEFQYYHGAVKDSIDQALKDFTNTTRRFVLESTGLAPTLEKMIADRNRKIEDDAFTTATEERTLDDLMEYEPEDNKPITEDDAAITDESFDEDN